MQIKYEVWMLLSEETIGYYNRLLRIMEPIGSELPRLWALLGDAQSAPLSTTVSEESRSYRDRVQRVAELLKRRHYRVGLLGRSGVGKSSLFNSIIRTDSINAEGRGTAKTRAVTRLYRVESASKKCKLIYMTRLQFQERRNDYCQANGFAHVPPDANKKHAIIVEENSQLLTKLRELPVAADKAGQLRRKNFEDLLTIYNDLGEKYIQSDPFDEPGDFEKHNTHYINHPEDPNQAADQYVLLREVEIGYPTKHININLHLLDLPGLGTINAEDDSLTQSYLRDSDEALDGAIIVTKADEPNPREVTMLLKSLKTLFRGSLNNRAWLVVNKWKGTGTKHIYGDEHSPTTVFDTINTGYRDILPETQLLFTENEYYQTEFKAQDKPQENGQKNVLKRPDDNTVCSIFSLKKDERGKIIFPAVFEQYKQQQQLFNTMLDSGGVPELRHAIEQTIVTAVRGQVEIDTCQQLLTMTKELEGHVQAARDHAHLPTEVLEDCSLWQNAIKEAADDLCARVMLETPLRSIGRQLRKTLRNLCGSILTSDQDTNPAKVSEAIANKHTNTIQTTLSHLAKNVLFSDFVKKMTRTAKESLETKSKGLSPLSLPSGSSETSSTIPALFQARLDLLIGQCHDWLLPIVNSIQTTPLFAHVDTTRGKRWEPDINVEQYRELMQGKLDVILGNALLVFEGRLREAFEDIQQRITLMMNVKDKDTPTNEAIYTNLLTEIATLSAALKTHVSQHRGGNHASR